MQVLVQEKVKQSQKRKAGNESRQSRDAAKKTKVTESDTLVHSDAQLNSLIQSIKSKSKQLEKKKGKKSWVFV